MFAWLSGTLDSSKIQALLCSKISFSMDSQFSIGYPSNMPQRVLIADQEEPFIRIAAKALEALGVEIVSANRGGDVLQCLQRESVDLIMADTRLPGIDGITLCRRLAEHDTWGGIPVLLMSTDKSYGQRLDALNSGAVDFLVKPFLVAELQARVSTQLRLRQMHQTNLSLQEQAASSERSDILNTFSIGIGHNFNNLLTAAFGFLCLAQGEAENHEVVGHLRNIDLALKRMSRLTKQLMSFAGEAGGAFRSTGLHRLFTNALAIFEPTALRSHQVILCDIGDLSDVWVYGDEFRLTQGFLHVLNNAREAMTGPRGQIRIRGTVENREACLAIQDSGPGMSEDSLKRALDPFFTTKEGVGCGLGLCMTEGVLKEMGGRLEMESAKGKGTTVKMILPLSEESGADDGEVKSSFLDNLQILVAIDAEESAEAIQKILVSEGFAVDRVDSSLALEKRLAQYPGRYSAVLVDILRGDLFGDPMVAMVRGAADIPVVYAVSTQAEAPGSWPELQLLQKPFTPESLLQALKKFPRLVRYGYA